MLEQLLCPLCRENQPPIIAAVFLCCISFKPRCLEKINPILKLPFLYFFIRTSSVIKNVGTIKVCRRAPLLIRSIWPSWPEPIQRLLLILSGIYCGLSRWFHQGWVELSCVVKGGISGDLAEIFRGEGNIKMMTGWVGWLLSVSLLPFLLPAF